LALSATIATATAAAATTITPAATATLFGCIPAGLAFFGLLKPFGLVKLLLFAGKGKFAATGATGKLGIGCHWLKTSRLWLLWILSRGPFKTEQT
jgi:hypothetical protein